MNKPNKINLPHGISGVKDFSCGEEHAAILTHDGVVYLWGYGNDG
jgi:alpha-tubulin suppressor-like RCC1 family protein